ncbi:uncharacterized protein LOC130907528 isoform X2 [Corythoichthys intestinalis]|uniref:uncharacterized protein LOC130907528 isoform X2 n=1 Tax=Corythoichthys intestinalis TaxID=161448 RepID=UPI0025A639ED|nr:uncharacterized protein LOC130907528 isoform X2 [Corythoichthys intestinalis]
MSENSEEQQSPGVLGRIGSWLSPWRGRSPKSPTENSSLTCDQAVKSEGECCEESTQAEARKHEPEEKEQVSNPNSRSPSRDIFHFEEVDATQSAHREGSVVSSRETPPKEEEFLLSEKKRIGQAKERCHGTSASGNSDRIASHLTDLSSASSSEQGVVLNSDQVNTQPLAHKHAQAQTGKRLHVYLEETSVTHCGKDKVTGQKVIRTTIEKNLPVLSKSKSPKSPGFDLSRSSVSSTDENINANLKPVVVPQEGVSQNLHKDWQLDLGIDQEPTEAGNMGRKNSAKRKGRKNSHGDAACSLQEKNPSNVQPEGEGIPCSDSSTFLPEGESPQSQGEEQPLDSSSKHSLTSLASPGGGENETSCPKYADKFLGSGSVTETRLTRVVDDSADMDEDDSFYKVERKTETPESKRRSIKVSRSEVKLFPKNVSLSSKKSIAEVDLELRLARDQDKNEEKEGTKKETNARQQDKKVEEKNAIGRIADKINLFECQGTVPGLKRSLHNPRSADVSPARSTTGKLQAEFLSRSKSAERYGAASSSPATPQNEITLTVKERARNFATESRNNSKSMIPQKSTKTGTTKKSTTSVATTALKSLKPDFQGKLDTKAVTGITLKPDGQDTTADGVKASTPLEQHGTLTSKVVDQGTKSNSVEVSVSTKGTGDHADLTDNLSPRSKAPNRSGSRSKRRKSKEATSPVSENQESKPNLSKQEATSLNTHVDEPVFLPSDEVEGIISNKHTFTKESDISDKQLKYLDGKNIDKLVNRVEKITGPKSVNKDEPDTIASNGKAKKPIDNSSVSLAQKEVKAEREILSPKQDIKNNAEDESSSRSQLVEQHIKQPSTVVQDPPAKHPKLYADPASQSSPISTLKTRQSGKKDTEYAQPLQNMDPKKTSQSETKYVNESKRQLGDNNRFPEEKDKDTLQKIIHSDKTQTQLTPTSLQSIQDNSKIEESAVMDNQKNQTTIKETRPLENINKTELIQAEGASNLPTSKLTVNQTATTNQGRAEVNMVNQETGKKRTQRSSKEEMASNVSEVTTKSLEGIKSEHKLPVTITEQHHEFGPVEKLEGSLSQSSNKHKGIAGDSKNEQVTAKVSHDLPALISEQTDNTATVKGSTQISAQNNDGKSQSSQTQRSKGSFNEGEVEASKTKSSCPQFEELNNTVKTSDLTSFKDSDKKQQRSSDTTLTSSTVIGQEKKDTKEIELPPSVSGDLSSQLNTGKDEQVESKQTPTSKVSTSPKAKKLNSDSVQLSSPKRLHSPRGLSRDDSSLQQDAPSSWLDVDFPKQRLKFPGAKLSASVSESNLLDTDDLDDENFIERIKKLCAPFSLPPRKHNPLRTPQPPFAMPAIKEDHFEKTFDPEEFKFGLRKKNRSFDTGPSLLAKLQNPEIKGSAKPARVSIADRCLLISSLDNSQLKEKTPKKDEEGIKEEKDDHIVVKSRLEGSCVLSSLTTHSARGRRNGVQALSERTNSTDVSPELSPSSDPTTPIQTSTISFAENSTTQRRAQTQPTEAVVSDSGPPFPSFNDIKLPDYLEKYLPREPVKTEQRIQEQPQIKAEVTEKMSTPASVPEADLIAKPSMNLPNNVSPFGNGNTSQIYPAHSELKQPLTQRMRSNHARTAKGFHKRPGKIMLFQNAQFSGQVYEIYRDVEDATHLQFSSIISVKVIRGCWILYEKPDFQGRCIALEEGGLELTNEWADPETNTTSPMLIGSIRLAIRDYSTPQIDLFTEPEGHGRLTSYHDDAIEIGSFGIPLSTASIQVHAGVWLVFSDPGFQGMLAVLETGVYPVPEAWGFPSPFVGSLKPLKMGGFKVENPNEVKALVYEKPGLEGSYLEIDSDIFNFCDDEGDETNSNTLKLKSVGSMKIIGGFWVGYSEEGFEGQQYMLEEGEYMDCNDWGGSGQILSLRPILSDFLSPHLKMFSNQDFSDRGMNIDLIVPVINMDDTGYGTKTQSVDVISGTWVVFEDPGFCGESYILEKGLYGNPEDWGALQHRISSVMPVVLDDFENVAKFKVQLFSKPGFQGTALTLENSVATLQEGFSVASCKVLVGSWLAFEAQDYAGKMYLLEEGNYQDMRAMGCINPSATILSVQTVGFEFSQPSIILFERSGLRGKRVVLTNGCVNLQLAEGCARVQSVLVEGGMWILYEGINYRGAQILIKPGEVPDWRQFSKWSKIGSLRPLLQRHVHFRLRNRQTRLMMSVTGDLEDVKLLRIQEAEATDGLEQIWVYRGGHLHCKLLEECCLSPSGSVTIAGSRVGLTSEVENHAWSITPEGFIRYLPTSDLVLEVKGGLHYDKNQVILNTLDRNKAHQKWDVEII